MSASSTTIDGDEIISWLPHRHPFLLIDHATGFIAGEKIVGHKALQHNDPWFEGHFPGNPIMPGVLLIECMAQVGALLAAKSWNIQPTDATIFFPSVEKAKFRQAVKPLDTLEIPVQIIGRKRDFVRFEGNVLVSQKTVASCTFMAVTVENTQ